MVGGRVSGLDSECSEVLGLRQPGVSLRLWGGGTGGQPEVVLRAGSAGPLSHLSFLSHRVTSRASGTGRQGAP